MTPREILAAWDEAVAKYRLTEDKSGLSPEWWAYMCACTPLLNGLYKVGVRADSVQLPYSQALGV